MNQPTEDISAKDAQLVDAYLDDQMRGDERQQFEQRLDDAPALRETIELQQSIDRCLRQRFDPPQVERLLESLRSSPAVPHAAPAKRFWWRWPAVGAAAALVALLVFA